MLLSLVLPERLLRKLIRPLVMKLTDIQWIRQLQMDLLFPLSIIRVLQRYCLIIKK